MVHDVSEYYMLKDFATYICQRYRTARERSPFLKIGAMLAYDQESGSLPVSSDFWKKYL